MTGRGAYLRVMHGERLYLVGDTAGIHRDLLKELPIRVLEKAKGRHHAHYGYTILHLPATIIFRKMLKQYSSNAFDCLKWNHLDFWVPWP